MTYINARLPRCVAYGFAGGPEWSTLIVPLDNGREHRNRQWMYPRHRYTASYLNLSDEARDEVLAAYHATAGRWGVFRFKDRNDHRATNEVLAAVAGTLDPVQLTKRYRLGDQEAVRLVQAPVSDTVGVFLNGIAVEGTLDDQLGLFLPSQPWGAGIATWSGEFDVWVRFDSDWNAFSIDNVNANNSSIDLVEVRR